MLLGGKQQQTNTSPPTRSRASYLAVPLVSSSSATIVAVLRPVPFPKCIKQLYSDTNYPYKMPLKLTSLKIFRFFIFKYWQSCNKHGLKRDFHHQPNLCKSAGWHFPNYWRMAWLFTPKHWDANLLPVGTLQTFEQWPTNLDLTCPLFCRWPDTA